MDIRNFFDSEFAEHIAAAQQTHQQVWEPFRDLLGHCVKSIQKGGKIIFFGNGGSAADAQHLATELVVRYRHNRIPIPALSLATDTSALTAIGNDLGFDHLFSRQIEALGKPGDVAIGITTSGKSPNVINALKKAKEMSLIGAALTGGKGGILPSIADPLIIIPSFVTARIQEMHIMVGQMLCDALEKELKIQTFPV